MRAAKAPAAWQWPVRRGVHGAQPQHNMQPGAGRVSWTAARATLVFAVLFFAGYLCGLILSRTWQPAVGEILAAYYTEKLHFTNLATVFAAFYSAFFLQLMAVLIFGSSPAGLVLMTALFLLRGSVLGICAAALYRTAGMRGLVIYWLLTFLPDATSLLLLLWVSGSACMLSHALLQLLLGGGTVRGALKVKAQSLLYRFGIALIAGAVCGVLGAASAILFAAVLL